MKTIHSVRGYAWPPSLFKQPRGNSLGARLNFIMIPLKMVERFSIFLNQLQSIALQKSCRYMLYSKILKASLRYILSDLFELKNE